MRVRTDFHQSHACVEMSSAAGAKCAKETVWVFIALIFSEICATL